VDAVRDTAQVAHTGDTVPEKLPEVVPLPGNGVDVHIPEPWDQELAAAVDDASGRGLDHVRLRGYADDAIPANGHGPIGQPAPVGDVDDGDVSDRERSDEHTSELQ